MNWRKPVQYFIAYIISLKYTISGNILFKQKIRIMIHDDPRSGRKNEFIASQLGIFRMIKSNAIVYL